MRETLLPSGLAAGSHNRSHRTTFWPGPSGCALACSGPSTAEAYGQPSSSGRRVAANLICSGSTPRSRRSRLAAPVSWTKMTASRRILRVRVAPLAGQPLGSIHGSAGVGRHAIDEQIVADTDVSRRRGSRGPSSPRTCPCRARCAARWWPAARGRLVAGVEAVRVRRSTSTPFSPRHPTGRLAHRCVAVGVLGEDLVEDPP